MFHTSSGLAIKSLSPFVGTAQNIRFTNIKMKNVGIGMAINFFRQGVQDVPDVPDVTNQVWNHRHDMRWSDGTNSLFNASAFFVLVENVSGTVLTNAGHIDCLGSSPCKDFHFVNVQLKSSSNDGNGGGVAKGYSCMNVSGTYDARCSPLPCFAPP